MAYYDYDRVKDRVLAYQFRQAEEQQLPLEINSYADALDWWKRRDGQEYRGTSDRPVAKREWNTRRMRMRRDGSIEFEFDGEVLAVWHPDKTLTIDPFSGNKYGAFEGFVTPRSIETQRGARTGKLIFLKPGRELAEYSRIAVETDTGMKTVLNPDISVIRGPATLKFDRSSKRWVPASERHLKLFEWFELDKGRLREAGSKYHVSDFVDAISSALQLGANIQTSPLRSSSGVTVLNDGGEDILTLLEQRRFVEAAANVRTNFEGALMSTDVRKIRHLAYEEMGLIYLEQQPVLTLPQLNTVERRLADFGTPKTGFAK